MLEFISVKNTNLLQKHDIKLENLGKSTGFMGCGKKIYLVFDQHKKEWGVTRLDFFQRILRFFGFYKSTYKEVVGKHLFKNPCVLENKGFTKRVQDIWGIHFPQQENPSSTLSGKKPVENPNQIDSGPQNETTGDNVIKDKMKMDEIPDDLSSIYNQSDDENYNGDDEWFNTGEWVDFDMDFEKDSEYPIPKKHLSSVPPPIYQHETQSFAQITPEAQMLEAQYKKALPEKEKLNVEKTTLFGNWVEMGWNSTVEAVRKGPEFQILEKIAIENPQLGNHLFLGIRGDGKCGYRALVSSLIHNDCIMNNQIEDLQYTFIQAYNDLNPYWTQLYKDHTEVKRFEISKDKVLHLLEGMNDLNQEKRIEQLRNEQFLEPFLTFIRCIAVSQTKRFDISPPAQLGDINDEYINVESVQANLFSNYLEAEDLGIDLEEFLKRKGIGDDGTLKNYWLSGCDQDLIGYALKKNICCIWGDRKDVSYQTHQIFPNKKPDFYTMNLNVKHYHALVPTSMEATS